MKNTVPTWNEHHVYKQEKTLLILGATLYGGQDLRSDLQAVLCAAGICGLKSQLPPCMLVNSWGRRLLLEETLLPFFSLPPYPGPLLHPSKSGVSSRWSVNLVGLFWAPPREKDLCWSLSANLAETSTQLDRYSSSQSNTDTLTRCVTLLSHRSVKHFMDNSTARWGEKITYSKYGYFNYRWQS